MNFAPHHAFTSCSRLEQTIERLRKSGSVAPDVYASYARYHFSLIHKLRSARYHVDGLEAYLRSQNAQQLDPTAVVYRVNFYFDGFLQTIGSALDILAREAIGYFSIAPAGHVYYWSARQLIAAARPGDPCLPFLADPAWKQELSDYRNTATHESLIGTNFRVDIRLEGNQVLSKLVFPAPDDPRQNPSTYRRNPDIAQYCSKTFKRVLSHVNQFYGHVEQRAGANNSLPL